MQLTPDWKYVSDGVMGGLSQGRLDHGIIAGRQAARLSGAVSTANNGGFIQMAFDLDPGAETYRGIGIEVYGNGARYDLRLRTHDLTRPWQSFRRSFVAGPAWQQVDLPFETFEAHRTEAKFDPARLRRIGILAIGADFEADIASAGLWLY